MRHAACRMTPRVNRRRPARGGKWAATRRAFARFPTSTKTHRAALFRRALVEPAERAARARRLGNTPHFCPPSASAGCHLASTLRLPARLRSSRPQDSAPAADFGRSRAHVK
jgi:hypothetical protein